MIESSSLEERKHKKDTKQLKRSSFRLLIPPVLAVCIRPTYHIFQLHHNSWYELLGTNIIRLIIINPPTKTHAPLH